MAKLRLVLSNHHPFVPVQRQYTIAVFVLYKHQKGNSNLNFRLLKGLVEGEDCGPPVLPTGSDLDDRENLAWKAHSDVYFF